MADYSKSLLDEPDHYVVNVNDNADDDETELVVRVQQQAEVENNYSASASSSSSSAAAAAAANIQLSSISSSSPSCTHEQLQQQQQQYHHEQQQQQHFYEQAQYSYHEQQQQQLPQMQQNHQQPPLHSPLHLQNSEIQSSDHLPIKVRNLNNSSNTNNNSSGNLLHYFKGSIHLAFLSHLCFVIASLFYIKLSFIQLSWIQYTMIENDLTTEILMTDDDVTWNTWANENQGEYREAPTYLQLTRLTYGDDYTKWCTRGAAFFVLVGTLDWLRYCDKWNVFMILAGLAGLMSGYSQSQRAAAIWETISVHLYFLESITLLKRVHYYPMESVNVGEGSMVSSLSTTNKVDDNGIVVVAVGDHYLESSSGGCNVVGRRSSSSSSSSGGTGGRDHGGGGFGDNGSVCTGISNHDGCIRDAATYINEHHATDYPCFRVGDMFFFLGGMLDIVGSYISLAGMVGIWIAYTDLVACFLWLGCALIAISAEIYYLQKQVATCIENGEEYDLGCLHCY
ncbi:hypothetical protein ACHAWU_007453 [Discostella pseudostelligera]|uniref:Uncharacterized protein n=1 Tax=Discostella pseudostelligera TaxID=259834 RepID=A0ABD3MS45_9STRA